MTLMFRDDWLAIKNEHSIEYFVDCLSDKMIFFMVFVCSVTNEYSY